jgi:DNA polymerase
MSTETNPLCGLAPEQVRAYIEYFRDLGVHDFYRRGEPMSVSPRTESAEPALALVAAEQASPDTAERQAVPRTAERSVALPNVDVSGPPVEIRTAPAYQQATPESSTARLISFNDLAPLPEVRVERHDRAQALQAIREEIGDCTRCPLAYAGRRTIVFGDGDAGARLMFVGEGPGADEDASGVPFVGKAGQLLNNMIAAMGLKREQVYIANIVKCRPPQNRVPEVVEANTCSQFLLRQMDVVQPEVVVALGSTAAIYLLGVKQSLNSLRGRWHEVRGAKLAVTYHPAFLLRDPRQKGEAWKDLQMVMAELGLKAPSKG